MTAIQATSPDESRPDQAFKRRMVTISVMLVAMLQALDMTIAAVALPHMQGSLSAAQDQITWVLTTYAVATAVAMPLVGWLADRYGRRQVMLASVAGFTLASLLCGMANSLPEIVIARLLQGALGAGLIPLSQAVMLDAHPREQHTRAMALWGTGVMLGPILGPTLGGWLTDHFSWRWVFLINIPIGLIAYFGIQTFQRKDAPDITKRFDMFGFVTLSLFLGLLQAVLDRGERLDWFNSAEIRIEAFAGALAFALFLAHTLTLRNGSFFNIRLLQNRNFVCGLLCYFVVGTILSASRALFPPILQGMMNYSVMDTGLVLAPSGIGVILAMAVAVRAVVYIDARWVIAAGFVTMGYSIWLMTGYTLVMDQQAIIWPNFLQGVGLGLCTTPLTALAFSTLAPNLRNEGTTFYSLLRNLGGGIGISITQAVVTRNTQAMHASLAENVTPYNPAFASPSTPLFDIHSPVGLALIDAEINRQAAMVGYLDAFWLMLMLVVAALPLLLLISRPRHAAEAVKIHADQAVPIPAEPLDPTPHRELRSSV